MYVVDQTTQKKTTSGADVLDFRIIDIEETEEEEGEEEEE